MSTTDQSPIEKLKVPLPLPRFTFLNSRDQQCRVAIAGEIMLRDKNICDVLLQEPLYMAACQMFFGGYRGQPIDETFFNHKIGYDKTIKNWIDALDEMNCGLFHDGYLADRHIDGILEDATLDVFERYLILDMDDPAQCKVYAQRFPGQVCVIHVDELPARPEMFGSGVKHIWTANREIKSAMAEIERELGLHVH